MPSLGRGCLMSLVEALYPERCLLCDAGTHLLPPGRPASGLRPWDRPHLCRGCWSALRRDGPLVGDRAGRPILAGAPTGARLVTLVSAWKYRGVRGLAWPLAALARRALERAEPSRRRCQLVPLPVHGRRRRERGFDQARILGDLLAAATAGTVRHDVLFRIRATPQQAKLDSQDGARKRNVEGAFAASVPVCGELPLLLVDDLVTSGATAAAAAQELTQQGWDVRGVVCCGLALPTA